MKPITITGRRMRSAFAFFLILLISCRKSDTTTGTELPPPAVNAAATTGNLLVNGSLTTLKFWPVAAAENGIIRSGKAGVLLSGNKTGAFTISQRVTLPEKSFYKVSVTANYTLNDYSSAGIYVMDSTMTRTIGEFEQVYSAGTNSSWQFVFYNRRPAQVVLIMGCLNGINGTVELSNVSLEKYMYQPRLKTGGLSAYLSGKFPLVFTPGQYDSTIDRISDYLNSVLLCRWAYYSDTAELPKLDNLIGSDTAYAYFNSYRHNLDSIVYSYCQKSSLSLGEILTNEFNIPVRQIYMSIGGVGQHQFLEYWNPFSARWLMIDPCFSARYVRDAQLLGDEEVDKTTAPGHLARFGQYYYYPTLDPLVQFWQQLDELVVKDYYAITFPFAGAP